MERIVLTTEQQAYVDAYRVENSVQPTDVVMVGTNVVVDDHLQAVDTGWPRCVVLRGANGAIDAYWPEWEFTINVDLDGQILDRAGPNGQTMPIYDQQQMMARTAKAAPHDPKHAEKDKRVHLREFLAAQTPETAKKLRKELQKHGALDKDDDEHGHEHEHKSQR